MKYVYQTLMSVFLLPVYVSAMITSDQLEFYNQNGYLVIPHFYTEQECDILKYHVEDMLESFDEKTISAVFLNGPISAKEYFMKSGDNISYFFEKGAVGIDGNLNCPKNLSLNKIGHAMHDLDPIFDVFSRYPKLAELTDDLGVHNPLLIQSMYIFKQPFIGGEVSCHQDSTFLISEPNTIIGYWVAIEDATLENGCLWVMPGGHALPLKKLFTRKDNTLEMLTFDATPWELQKLIPLEAKKGTIIVIHGHLPHMSYTNTSPKSRHAFTLHVMDASSKLSELNWLRRSPDFPFKGFEK